MSDPNQFLVDKSNAATAQTDDFCDVISDTPTPTAAPPVPPRLLTNKDFNIRNPGDVSSPPPKQQEEEVKVDEAERLKEEKIEQMKQANLLLAKSNPLVKQHAASFLKDMAGVEKMQITYTPFAWVTLILEVIDAETLEQITRQSMRDLFLRRNLFTAEGQYVPLYRLAGSLVRFQFSDPQTGQVQITYDREANAKEVGEFEHADLADSDTNCRRIGLYLMHKVLKGSRLYMAVMQNMSDFDQLQTELSLVAAGDPDFFQKCLSEAS